MELIKSVEFDRWLRTLRDRNAIVRIAARMVGFAAGNYGHVKPLGGGLSELRIDYGPGYRVYFVLRGPMIVVLMCVGDTSTQDKDIKKQGPSLTDGRRFDYV
jgi:putative addiction module killer protein